MTYGELKRRLRRIGVYLDEQRRRHEMWYNPRTGGWVAIPRHDAREVSPGILYRILRDLGLTREDLQWGY